MNKRIDAKTVLNAERVRRAISELGLDGVFREEALGGRTVVFEREVEDDATGMPHAFAIVALPDRIECSFHSPVRILASRRADFVRRFLLPINRVARSGRLDLFDKGNYVYHAGMLTDYVSDFTGRIKDAIGEVMGVLVRSGGRMAAFACE